MDKQTLSKKITGVENELEKLLATIRSMAKTDPTEYPENYELLSTDAALRAELITCRLRHLIYQTTGVKKQEYLASAGIVQGISIVNMGGALEITIPCLLPKKKQRKSTEYLIDPLYFTLSSFAYSHGLPHFKHCVVCFSHIYDETLSQRLVRDYDNMELKQILDVISGFVMEDDTGLLCDAYNTTEFGKTACTRITIMDKDSFPAWLEERKNTLKSISDF